MEQFNTQQTPLGRFIGVVGLTYLAISILDSLLNNDNDTVNYMLKNKSRIVYDGITYEDRLDFRLAEHVRQGKKFDLCIYDEAKPRAVAEKIEKKRIRKHRAIYNIHHNRS